MLRLSLVGYNTTKPDARWLCSRRIGLSSVGLNVRVGTLVGPEKPVPDGVYHSEIAVRVQMVDEVKLLLAPEPSEMR
jgi:hypothetical protein